MSALASKTKPFIGSVLRHREQLIDSNRPELIAVETLNPADILYAGSILFAIDEPSTGHGSGRVTSITYSPLRERHIGLGFFRNGSQCIDNEIRLVNPIEKQEIHVRIIDPHFYDPKGSRMRDAQ